MIEQGSESMEEFTKEFNRACGRNHPSKVWGDFCYMAAAAFSNAVDKRHAQAREERYLQIIRGYNPDEQQVFPQLMVLMVDAFERHPFQDFLGKQYMELELGNRNTGQFFTPYDVCHLMAEITVPDTVGDTIREKGYITLNDCACGAGATLIAAAEVMHQRNINYQMDALFIGQDLDFTVAMMCYLQMSMLGMAGYVHVGDTLTEPITGSVLFGAGDADTWYTPMYFHTRWAARRELAMVRHVFHGTSLDAPQPIEHEPVPDAEPPVIELQDASAHGQIQGQMVMDFD